MDNNTVIEYRARLLEQLLKSADAFCAACRAATPATPRRSTGAVCPAVSQAGCAGGAREDTRKPLDADHWNVHQLAQHVRDVDVQSYEKRIRRTLTEDAPLFPKFDADLWASEHYNPDEPLEKILTEFEDSVHNMVAELKTQPESAWSRLGRHEIQGDRTLQIWVERSLEHIQEHLETVKTITSRK